MAERRVWLGTGAMVMGLGAALLSGSGTAHADGGGADDGSGAPKASDSSPASSGKTTAGSRRAQASAARSDSTPTGSRSSASRQAAKSTAAVRPKPATAVGPRVESTPDAPDTTAAVDVPETTAPAAQSVVSEPAPVVASVGRSRRVVAAVARQAQIDQMLASAGTATASPGTDVAPSAALAALNLLSGLAVPRPTASSTTEPAAQVASPAPLLPVGNNGVTGVQIGHSRLTMPGAFIGDTVAADWYLPTQADGSVKAQGVIWLQHGFGASNTFYSALAQNLAQQTNSIVVSPTLSSLPLTFSGGCLTCATSQQAAAAFFGPNRAALLDSAIAAGFTGDELPERFVLAGHSAGGGFATTTADDYLKGNDAQYDPADLVGVVMFDGVSNGALDGSFAAQVRDLADANKPIYQIAAPAQSWNLFGATTNVLAATLAAGTDPGTFVGVVLQAGSHVDSMLGVNPIIDFVLQLVTKRVPTGNTAAVYNLAGGWINDFYTQGAGPTNPTYGLYAASNQQIVMGPTFAYGLPSVVANQSGIVDTVLEGLINTVGGLFGFQLPTPVSFGNNGLDPNDPVTRVGNGVTGVRTGNATLNIPCGPNGYAAPATWYFPTQADGTVNANGVIWLQHGFLGFTDWYADTAQALAQQTNSVVVVPQMFWFDTPFCPGCFLGGDPMRVAAAEMFQGARPLLNASAREAGFEGTLPEKFILSGHSAGGNFATAVGALITDTPEVDNLLGVVMFDGVSRPPVFTEQLQKLIDARIPDYQIAAPPQSWNAYGVATEAMYTKFQDQFYGVQIDNGSHTDVLGGDNLFAYLADVLSAIIVKTSPPGAKEAVRTFATGWINDIYNGNTTYTGSQTPVYGIYGRDGNGPQNYAGENTPIVMGQAGAATLPSPPPVTVDPNLPPDENYLGTWYEQGSVRQFFSIGLVNTKAQYSLNPDGTIKVQNSGNYFFANGPAVNIVGTAVPVNAFNTRLNVGFFFGTPSSDEPGNYWILDYAPDYSWAIVSDPSGRSGFILTREQTITDQEYDELVARAKQLGVSGWILRTRQYPSADPNASLPGPAEVPASVVL